MTAEEFIDEMVRLANENDCEECKLTKEQSCTNGIFACCSVRYMAVQYGVESQSLKAISK